MLNDKKKKITGINPPPFLNIQIGTKAEYYSIYKYNRFTLDYYYPSFILEILHHSFFFLWLFGVFFIFLSFHIFKFAPNLFPVDMDCTANSTRVVNS